MCGSFFEGCVLRMRVWWFVIKNFRVYVEDDYFIVILME